MQGYNFHGMFICIKDFTYMPKRFNIQRSDGRGKPLQSFIISLKFFSYDVQCFFIYLEYNIGKNTMAVSILPDTINPDLDVRDVIVLHNFRFQVGLLYLIVKYFARRTDGTKKLTAKSRPISLASLCHLGGPSLKTNGSSCNATC